MFDYDIQRCTRRCHASGRDLRPGEVVYSALVPSGASVERQDFAEEAWPGPPEHAIGWWKGVLADAGGKRMHWAPNDVMLHYFEQLDGNPAKEDLRYVLALLMVRRRIVRVEATEKDPSGRETLVVFCPRNEVEYRVAAVMPDESRAAEIQEELAQLLESNVATQT